MKKKVMKKADGGMMDTPKTGGDLPVYDPKLNTGGGSMGRTAPMPNPNARARMVANAKARFNRPITGGGGGVSSGNPPITTMPINPLKKGGMPMRKAKGGSVKKADGGPIKTRISNLRERAANIRENVGDRFPQKDYDMSRIRAGVRNRMGLKKGGMAKGKKK